MRQSPHRGVARPLGFERVRGRQGDCIPKLAVKDMAKNFEISGTVTACNVGVINVAGVGGQGLPGYSVTLTVATDDGQTIRCQLVGGWVHQQSKPPSEFKNLEGHRVVLQGREERLHPFTRVKSTAVKSIYVVDAALSIPVSGSIGSPHR
jgi:hypothetical protein